MNPEITSKQDTKDSAMKSEYDFTGGVRGKHYRAMQAGYSITVREDDGTTVTKEMLPKEGAVILEPDLRDYFPDSESVNRALRCLLPLLTPKHQTKPKNV